MNRLLAGNSMKRSSGGMMRGAILLVSAVFSVLFLLGLHACDVRNPLVGYITPTPRATPTATPKKPPDGASIR